MMKYNIKLQVAYDGSRYYGWQNTKQGPSIEGELERSLHTILQHPVILQAASRTDAGVHAEGQVVNFFTEQDPLDLERLFISLNQLLPDDIRVYDVQYAPLSFHPTLDSTSKEYHYHINTEPCLSPFQRAFTWHLPKKLDLSLMREAAALLIGMHDFQGLTNVRKPPHQDTIREIFSLDIAADERRLCVQIKGNHFLYKMVRNIVGTLCYIGCHKLGCEDLLQALKLKTRSLAGMTAPACGLVLKKIYYT
jgi:tRNA pseudouridine38-40 synthase